MAPGKQGPADDGKRWDSLSPAMDVAFAIEKKNNRSGGGLGEEWGGVGRGSEAGG